MELSRCSPANVKSGSYFRPVPKGRRVHCGKTLPENFQILLDPDYIVTNRYGLRWDAPRETAYSSTFVIDGQLDPSGSPGSARTHGGRANAAEILEALTR